MVFLIQQANAPAFVRRHSQGFFLVPGGFQIHFVFF